MKKEENTTRQVAVYGSLRMGEYNYNHFKASFPDIEHTGTHTISGFKLFSLGSYPAICVGENDLIVDTFNVSERCFGRMDGMEKGAGYHQLEIKVEGNTHIIWAMPPADEWLREENVVKDGDWSKFVREREGKTKINKTNI